MFRFTGMLSFTFLLMAISAMAQPPAVLDADRNPLRSGVKYYVLPAATDTAGGLKLVGKPGSCPFHVGQEPSPTVATTGLPVTFTPSATGERIIREGMDFSVAFSESAVGNCSRVQSAKWSIGEEDPSTSRRFIVIGRKVDYFRIDKNQGLYNLGWCPNCYRPNCPRPRCGSADILIQNRMRFLTLDGPGFPLKFKKA